MYEHEQGIQIEKSALNNFAVKYVLEGILVLLQLNIIIEFMLVY